MAMDREGVVTMLSGETQIPGATEGLRATLERPDGTKGSDVLEAY